MNFSGNLPALLVSLLLLQLPAFAQDVARRQALQQTTGARKFAEFNRTTSPLEMMKQLDSFAELLRKEPQAGAWLIDYKGQIVPGSVLRLSFTVENYLIRKGGIEAFRLVRSGNWREGESTLELWYVPPGGGFPKLPIQTIFQDYSVPFKWDELYYLLQEEKAALKGGEKETLDSNYYNDPVVFLDSFRSEIALPQTGRGRIVIYPKKGDPPDLAQKIGDYQRRYLLRSYFVEPSRIAIEIGEPRARRKVELWVAPAVYPMFVSEFPPADSERRDLQLAEIATRLQNLKGVLAASRIFIIAYTGSFTDEQNVKHEIAAQTILDDIKRSLVNQYRIEPDRVATIDGGKLDEAGVELWIVPPGAIEPAPKLAEP
jgi:hypothetical protein